MSNNYELTSTLPRPNNYYQGLAEKRSKTNTLINVIPEQSVGIVEKLGKFQEIANAGVHVYAPLIHKIRYLVSLKEQMIYVEPQHAFTKDNVEVALDGNIYFKIIDPKKAVYGAEDYEAQLANLAQAVMRKAVGRLDLDSLFKERTSINKEVIDALEKATEPWGVKVLRYEIKDIAPTHKETRDALRRQSDAERNKRATVLESEGHRQAVINESEGQKTKKINEAQADAERTRLTAIAQAESIKVNASAEAESTVTKAKAQADQLVQLAVAEAKSIQAIAQSMNSEGGASAVKQRLADSYIRQYGEMMRAARPVIISDKPNDISGVIATALSINNLDKLPAKL